VNAPLIFKEPGRVLHRVHHQILRSHHLFEPLNEEELDDLMSSSQLLSVDKGEPLFRDCRRGEDLPPDPGWPGEGL
jgi:CRP/FNR family transcriptional regulator, dissimilatory nitrate respiration regulator